MVWEAPVALYSFVSNTVKDLNPRKWHRPQLNFIYSHYIYMVSLTIIGAIILYAGGGMGFMNALFFAAGASTQSGLNPLNINSLLTYQQVTMMLISDIGNPIFINTVVVFFRLHWFEKKFDKMVKDALEERKSRARSFSKSGTFNKTRSTGNESVDPDRLERGKGSGLSNIIPLRNRKNDIQVMHHLTVPNGMSGSVARRGEAEREFEKLGLPDSNGSSDRSDERQDSDDPASPSTYLGLPQRLSRDSGEPRPRMSRDITFADELDDSTSPKQAQHSPKLAAVREGGVQNEESGDSDASEAGSEKQHQLDKHIKFIQQQQENAQKQTGTLRIPGPKEVERGEVPQALEDDSDDEGLHRPMTRNTYDSVNEQERARRASTTSHEDHFNGDDHYNPRRITINVPEHPGHRSTQDVVDDEKAEDQGNGSGVMSRIKSGLTRRRNQSSNLNLTNAKGSMGRTFSSLTAARSKEKADDAMPYLSWEATIGRNSAFIGLTEEQREELGGIEYRSLKTLRTVLVCYYVGFHVLAMLCFVPYIYIDKYYKNTVVLPDGVNAGWWGVFTASSMFTDLGFTLTPDSMNSFNKAPWPLLTGSFFIIIGNTGFPIMLRFVIWLSMCASRLGSPQWEELKFLLDHPRRCFTLLFPARATWWLFWVLLLLNGIDLLLFCVVDLKNTPVSALSPGFKVLDGWFQAVSTRTAGFSCVDLADLHPGVQVSYLIMMYISVFPIAISVRRTNVYEEKSLGIWGTDDDDNEGGETSFIGQHLRRQLSFDLWYVFLGFFIIAIVEGNRLAATDLGDGNYAFTMFAVLFEIVSAYGTVGLSLGWPTNNLSFSAEFHILSKLVIVLMMIRGRHRGLPYALDRAIMLPGEKKDEDAMSVRQRRNSGLEPADLDEPFQDGDGAAEAAMNAGAGGDQSPVGTRRYGRRPSAVTTASQRSSRDPQPMRRHQRSRSIATVVYGAFNPAPTISRWD